MEISIEKVDMVVDRTGVSYSKAKEALEKNQGDVVDAIIYIESYNKTFKQSMEDRGEEILDKIKESIKKGNVTKIIIKKDGDIIMNIPITAGAIGTVLSPEIALLGVSAALLSKCSFEIVKEDGEIVNVNETLEKKIKGN